jgi:hypothetical protein
MRRQSTKRLSTDLRTLRRRKRRVPTYLQSGALSGCSPITPRANREFDTYATNRLKEGKRINEKRHKQTVRSSNFKCRNSNQNSVSRSRQFKPSIACFRDLGPSMFDVSPLTSAISPSAKPFQPIQPEYPTTASAPVVQAACRRAHANPSPSMLIGQIVLDRTSGRMVAPSQNFNFMLCILPAIASMPLRPFHP